MKIRETLYKTLLRLPILSILVIPLLIIRCSKCPLGGLCPIPVMYIGGIYGLLFIVGHKVKSVCSKLATKGRIIFPLLLIMGVVSGLLIVQAIPGADKLYVEPSSITVNYGEEAKVTIRVAFAHRQPCPYPTWEITYSIDGKVDVVSESKTEITSDGRGAIKELILKPYEDSTLTVMYKYGRGCPFGKEEIAKVSIKVHKPVETESTTTTTTLTPVTAPTTTIVTTETTTLTPTIPIQTQTTTAVTEETKLNILEYMYNYRQVILYTLMIVSLIMIYTIAKKARYSNPHEGRNLILARHVVMMMILLFLVILPIVLYGFICPCPIVIPQYILLPHLLSFNPLDMYIAVIIVALASSLIIARLWCGWLCPLGVSQEYLAKVYGKLKVSKRVDNILSKLKYLVLILLIVLVLLSQSPCWCYHCFIREFTTTIHSMSLPTGHIALLVIAIVMLALCILIPRFFCKYLCPVGALLEIMVKLKLYFRRVKIADKCRNCKVCLALKNCPMNLSKPGDTDCISCGNCIINCPFKSIKLER